ncbi:MAG: hypothetical protein RMJ00_02470 [Nitrososphaerota archaeon]|nr:hypothetical protein [Candidatus Bathyarchaeota archaeon]MCX8162902.1 hypothetical protein [Candidatus Bathyarchaeota archaeon]MDW8061545.1 hypothetical protein [Nitrososphaerota archaeon]
MIGESYRSYIGPILCSIVEAGRTLTVNDRKLHLRLDFYEDSIEEVLEAMRGELIYR